MRFQRQATFPLHIEQLAAFARALAHPARVCIVQALLRHETLCCREIVSLLPLAQATVSQHLKALKNVGLIFHQENGPRVEYRLDRGRLSSFCHSFQMALEISAKPETSNSYSP